MRRLFITFLAAIMMSVPASAAELIKMNFSATTQPALPFVTNPITDHTGQFAYILDADVVSLQEIDFKLGEIVFTKNNTGITKIGDVLFLGGLLNGPESTRGGTNDFTLAFPLSNGNGIIADFGYVLESDPTALGFTDAASITVLSRTSIGAVPEPATWALMLLGFFGVGGMLRSRRRRQEIKVCYA